MTSATVSISAQGRVSIPAPIRRELGLDPGTPLVTYIENGRVVLETRGHLIRRIQAAATDVLAVGESVVDELLADRRREAQAELQRMDA
ncbi:MAG: AbrB/MazE/SpoVT family DNA-binding domain-containing protein [Nocardioidaceae bacterium]